VRPSSIVRRYAEAAYDVATEDENVEEWLSQLHAVSERVQQAVQPDRRTADAPPPVDDQRRIFDWPADTDRIIDELR